MKKVFFLFLIMFLFMGNINIQAQYFYENPMDYANALPITTKDYGFNVIKGISTNESLENSSYIIAMNNDVSDYCPNGKIYASSLIHNYSSVGILEVDYTFENNIVIYCTIKYEDKCIYEYNKYENGYELLRCDEINLTKEFNSFKECYVDFNSFIFTINDEIINDNIYLESTMKEYLFSCLYGLNCSLNDKYDGDVYFVTSYIKPVTIDQIVNYVKVNDKTDGVLSFEIVNCNYNTNNKIDIGNYNFDIVAKDKAGNTTIQKCNISVVDVINPTISGEDKSCTYKYPITVDENDFLASDDNGIDRIEIIEDNYTANKTIPGEYKVTARAYDTLGNYSDCTIKVTVKDKTLPVLKVNSFIKTSTQEPITIEDIKKQITIIDEIDGVINDYTIIDQDLYFNNTYKFGTYRFIISYSDKSGNSNKYTYNVLVSDDDFPVITLENILVVSEGEPLSKEEIIAMLKATGEIIADDAELSSLYFDSDNPSGEYKLTILSNGNEIEYKILAGVDDNSINYSPNIENKVSNNINIGLIIGIVVILGTITTLGIIVYKKRH